MTLRQSVKYFLYGHCPGFAGAFPYYGNKVFFPKGAQIFELVCRNGIFEPEIVKLLTQLARPDTTIFDVGANVGLMALPILSSCLTCQVISFEPSPTSLPYLQKTMERSSFQSRWKIVGKALSNLEGEVEFFIGNAKEAMYEGFGDHRELVDRRSIKVPTSTLDQEWNKLGKPSVSVIKIDVEGAEGLVLAGARDVLRSMRPFVVLEWYGEFLKHFGTSPQILLKIAEEFNYRLFSIPTGVPIDDLPALQVQMMMCSNFVLMPRTSVEVTLSK